VELIAFVCTDTELDVGREAPGNIDACAEEGGHRGMRKRGAFPQGKSKAKTVPVQNSQALLADCPPVDTADWTPSHGSQRATAASDPGAMVSAALLSDRSYFARKGINR
jgi:hypothetical protein